VPADANCEIINITVQKQSRTVNGNVFFLAVIKLLQTGVNATWLMLLSSRVVRDMMQSSTESFVLYL